MYSEQLQNYLSELSDLGHITSRENPLLQESLSCYIGTLAELIQGKSDPPLDLLGCSLKLLSLSEALADLPDNIGVDGSHYLVAMGLEQTGELLSRQYYSPNQDPPLQNDHWYRLTLALLHYLAGGHRVQALAILRHLQQIASWEEQGVFRSQFRTAYHAIRSVYSGRSLQQPSTYWERMLYSRTESNDILEMKISRLGEKIRVRRQITLSELGLGDEAEFLAKRNITSDDAILFWTHFLEKLEKGGITSFTNDQIGDGFDTWLQPDQDTLVILPTGSGKTIIGELKTAITLAENKQVIWILPTKSLLRQARRDLSELFEDLNVEVAELPTTEDFSPLFSEELTQRKLIAAATPEKLCALIRSNPDALRNVGLVVLDEAQILFDKNRGSTAEYVILEINQIVTDCKFVIMSAFRDDFDRFRHFFNRLHDESAVRELTSKSRPTRRIYGIVTNQATNGVQYPLIQIYPAGTQSENDRTNTPLSISLTENRLTANPGPTDIAQSLLKSLSSAQLRTVMFVNGIQSTETQSEKIARNITSATTLPPEDVDRMFLELGRPSVIQTTANHGVTPHHSGLTRVEQHMVEKWTRKKIVKTVIATPTLAQGVNLPFDISIVSFLSRRNPSTEANEPLPISEVQNMIGRAGRAGQVSDGLCLIAMKSRKNPKITLDGARRYFFHEPSPTKDFLGLARLMAIASNSHIENQNWLVELENMTFSQAQTLVSFALRSSQGDGSNIRSHLAQYPSVQDLQEQFGEGVDVVDILAGSIEPMVRNLFEMFEGDPYIQEIMTRTGLPFEIIKFFTSSLQGDYDLNGRTLEDKLVWTDTVVNQAIQRCQNRTWLQSLLRETNVDRDTIGLFPAIRLWRNGASINEIEDAWHLNTQSKWNNIWIGKFFNHEISLFAQFWGGLSICEEVLFPLETRKSLEHIQTYVREGVNSIPKVEWLYRLGGIDRVLAHRLGDITPNDLDTSELREYTKQQMRQWRRDRNSIPGEIGVEATGALISIFEDK